MLFQKKILRALLPAVALAAAIAGCSPAPQAPTDTLSAGSIAISVDETYRPVIEQQLKVFDSSFPDAKITTAYKAESQCFQDLLDGKARLILVTRALTPQEQKVYEDQKIVATALPLARDAVAVIVNPESTDSVFSMPQLRGILTGQNTAKKYTVVFDNRGSSTLRFLTDSVLRGQALGQNVFAAKGNDSVVDYVARNPDAIGFIGLSYVADPRDTKTGAFLSRIRVAAVQNDSTGEFVKPYQAYIALRSYPLTRQLYYISRDNYPGLASGFANFLSSPRGQLIFQQAQLFPLRMNVVIRDASIDPGGVQTEQ